MTNRAEYIIPKRCDRCGSEDVLARVIYESGITRWVCQECGASESVPKVSNLIKRRNTSTSNWASRVIKHHPFCVICGSKENLEAHHIIPVAHSRRFMCIDTNGITLCHDCHRLVHNREDEL